MEKPVIGVASKSVKTCSRSDRIQDVIRKMLEKPSYRRLPVLYKGEFHGMVTIIDVLEFLCKRAPTLSSSVSRITETDIVTLQKEARLKDVLNTLCKESLGGCPIVDGKKLVGMVTERDLARMVEKRTGIKVAEAMSHPAIVRGHWPVRDVAKIICRGAFRRMPVVEKGVLLGVVAPYDILSYLSKKGKLDKLYMQKEPVSKILGNRLVTIGPKEDISSAVQRMEKHNVGGLPVEEDQELLGLITERDVLEVMA